MTLIPSRAMGISISPDDAGYQYLAEDYVGVYWLSSQYLVPKILCHSEFRPVPILGICRCEESRPFAPINSGLRVTKRNVIYRTNH